MEPQRRGSHRRDPRLEAVLNEVNDLLAEPETLSLAAFDAPRLPLILLVGCARSGTTLFMQWLAADGQFAYPSNLLARFFKAPYIGARIQQMLAEYDSRGEVFGGAASSGFGSELGKTKGALAPNEFWYFWRRFFHFGEIQTLDEESLPAEEMRLFRAELAALEHVFGRPLAMKAMIMDWHIPLLARLLPTAVFVHVRRDPFYNIQSLLEARVNFFGDRAHWYSFKPPQYVGLRTRTPIEQVAGQVYHTEAAIAAGLGQVPESRRLTVAYEDFCSRPADAYGSLRTLLQRSGGYGLNAVYRGVTSFSATNELRLPLPDANEVVRAYRELTGEECAP